MKIKIWAPLPVYSSAIQLQQQLQVIGFQAEVAAFVDSSSEDLFIIYSAFLIDAFPAKYIVYQTEVWGTEFFNDRYIRILKGALAVWDYHKLNAHYYLPHLPKWQQLSIVRPGISDNPKVEKDIKVVFYGSINERRKKILDEIKIPVKVIYGVYGLDMLQVLRRTKIVLNIKYYEQAPIELFRVTQSLSCGCHIISEPSVSEDKIKYSACVHWASSIREFEIHVENILNKPFDYNLNIFDNLDEIRLAMQQFKINTLQTE